MEYKISEFAGDLMEDMRNFCVREIRMQAVRIDRQQQSPQEVLDKVREAGLTGMFVTEGEEALGGPEGANRGRRIKLENKARKNRSVKNSCS